MRLRASPHHKGKIVTNYIMPPYLSDFFRENDPNYKQGYENGFRSGKLAAEKRIKAMLKELKELEAFSTSTATTGYMQVIVED